jgi:hypothetical protein
MRLYVEFTEKITDIRLAMSGEEYKKKMYLHLK